MPIHRALSPVAAFALAAGVLASTPAAAQSAPPSGSALGDPSAPLGSPANPIKQSSPTPPSDAYHLKAGDPTVISNAPIPDTRENRTRYGRPLSNGGVHTQPAGN
jgi:hypothetical protein